MDSNGRNRTPVATSTSSPAPAPTPPSTTTASTSTSTSTFRRLPSLARPFRRNPDKDKDKEKEKEKNKEETINEDGPSTSGNGHSRTLTFPSLSRVLGDTSTPSTTTGSSTTVIAHPQSTGSITRIDEIPNLTPGPGPTPRTSSLPTNPAAESTSTPPPLSPFPQKGSMRDAMVSALAPPVPILGGTASQGMDDMEPITYPSHLAQRLPPEAGPSSASSTPPPSTPATGTTSMYSTPTLLPSWNRIAPRTRDIVTPSRYSNQVDEQRGHERVPTANLDYVGPEPGPGGPPTGVPRRKESIVKAEVIPSRINTTNGDTRVNGRNGNSGTESDSGGNDGTTRKRATTKSAVDRPKDIKESTTTPSSGDINSSNRTRKQSRPGAIKTPTYIAQPSLPSAKLVGRVAASSMYFSLLPYHGRPPTQALRAHTGTLVGNRIWMIGGVDSKHCWRGVAWYDTESLLWSTVETAGEALPPLRAHTTTAVGTRLYIFGGGDGPTYSNDVWVFDTVSHRFSKPEIATPKTQLPPPRRAHTTVLYRNFLVIFGGGNGQTALNDIWALDISDPSRLTWEEWPTQGEAPARKGYHTANLVGDKMIVFGGSDGHASFADVHVLNLKNLMWTTVITDVKHNRLSHTSTQVGSYLFILGGHNGQSYAQDVLLFNLVTLQWESKIPKGQAPPGRGYHVALLHDARIFISGGYNGVSVFDDLWALDLSAAAYLPQVTTFEVDETRSFQNDIPA